MTMTSKFLTRDEAKQLGLKRYFTGLPCRNGHQSERITSNAHCIDCSRDWRQTPKGKAFSKKVEDSVERKKYKKNYNSTTYGKLIKRRSTLKRSYNLTTEEYCDKLKAQNNCCALCEVTFLENEIPVVDHNHITGKIRGIIHNQCNAMLGLIKESTQTLQKAVMYLRRYS